MGHGRSQLRVLKRQFTEPKVGPVKMTNEWLTREFLDAVPFLSELSVSPSYSSFV